MQETNLLILKYLTHLKESGLNYDKDTLDVAINCLQDAFKIEAVDASAELLTLVETSNPQLQQKSSEYKDQGNAAMASKNYDQADNLYSQAIEQSRRLGEPLDQRCIYYANRAAARKALGNTVSAIDDLKQALELNPDYQKGWLRLASYHEENGNKEAALNIYKQQHEKAPCAQTQEGLDRLQSNKPGFSKDELLKQFPMLGDALNDPEVQAMLQNPSVMAKLQQLQSNPMAIMQMMGDPEIKPLMGAIMKGLGGMMGGTGMDFGKMFGGQ